MFKNCFYHTKKSEIHLWEQIDNENLYTVIPWTPYVYLPAKEEDSDLKTIYGKAVQKKDFPSFYKYSKFQENNKRPEVYENNVRPEIQFLAERYHGIPDDELYVPKLKIYYLDIEVLPDEGFPDTKNPQDPVILISVRNSLTKSTITFGYDIFNNRDYTGDKTRYIKCKDEEELLLRFFNYMHKYPCDVLSGYNIWSFDLPYLIHRAQVIWGEEKGKDLMSRMSPINIVRIWKQKTSDDINIDIPGLTILDYYNVYKWYGKKLERYTLEYVSQKELGVGKLDWHEKYSSLKEFAERDWDEFTDYNVIDDERVDDLEEKLGYIRMIQGLSLLCKSPMKYYNAQTQLIEGLMLTHYRRNNLCAPHFYGGNQETFEAAHVKEPQRGLHEWVVDVDITSSYPSHIIALNMSLETFYGKITRMKEEEIISYTKNRKFPKFKMLKEVKGEWEIKTIDENMLEKFNKALERGLFAIAPNGAIFSTTKTGVISTVEKFVFFKRKDVKSQRKDSSMRAEELPESPEKKHLEEKAREYDARQLALKIMMNAFFGIIAVPYSRYFNTYISSAITACGRHTIKSGEKFCNALLNDPNDELRFILNTLGDEINYIDINENKDYVAYIDTDSLFVKLGEWIEDKGYHDFWKKLSEEEKIKKIKKISGKMEKYIDNRIFNEIQLGDYNSQVQDFKIGFKQEIIAQTALFVKKKKYAYWLKDKEGVPKDDIAVTGLEIVRSDSAEAIRPRLKKIMEMIMKQYADSEISAEIRKCKKELMQLKPEDLAANIGINNIKKYLGRGSPIKGTPWHVKGVYNYRLLLDRLNLRDKYEDIHEGNKAKVVYVKKNPYNIDSITFNDWPKEFRKVVQLDKQTMIEKFFIKKIKLLLEPIRKEYITERDDSKLNTFFTV